jgi:transposase
MNGGFYQDGKPLDFVTIHRILDHYFQQSDPKQRSIAATATAIGVYYNTVKKYIIRAYMPWKDARSYSHPHHTIHIKIVKFINYVTIRDHTLTNVEIQKLLWDGLLVHLHESQISRIRKHVLGYNRRRINLIDQRRQTVKNQQQRAWFKDATNTFLLQQFVFIDETHLSTKDLCRTYGYFKPGELTGVVHHYVSRLSYSFIVAMDYTGMLHYQYKNTTDEGVKATDFISFLIDLIPKLRPDVVLILDNARIHKTAEVMQILDNVPHMFLPPYSPDLNAIELMFGTTKALLKNYFFIDAPLVSLYIKCLCDVTPNHATNWVLHTIKKYKQ